MSRNRPALGPSRGGRRRPRAGRPRARSWPRPGARERTTLGFAARVPVPPARTPPLTLRNDGAFANGGLGYPATRGPAPRPLPAHHPGASPRGPPWGPRRTPRAAACASRGSGRAGGRTRSSCWGG